ncbi:MAG: alpha/beta fold hydrolase, partial [Isosphaeraceae bacterium]
MRIILQAQRFGSLAIGLLLWSGMIARGEEPAERYTGPWNVRALKQTPKATWGKATALVREVIYEGGPFDGNPTRVFAYYARPKTGDGPFPAMLLVHGGGGKAFKEWATLWADRGYVALAMDLSGRGPDGNRLTDGGPEQDDVHKFRDFKENEVGRMWTYHAVAAVLRGYSLLADRKEVDRDRIGVTGISWGGYLTCIIAGIDDRVKVAVPVYGCGFLGDNSAWLGQFGKMTPEQRTLWLSLFDPSVYLKGVTCPILFVNGTNDFAYPLDSYQKSYHLVPEPLRTLRVTVAMPHGHPQGWAPIEIGLFVDSVLKQGAPLLKAGPLIVANGRATAEVKGSKPIQTAQGHVTTDDGPWQTRHWRDLKATVDGRTIG